MRGQQHYRKAEEYLAAADQLGLGMRLNEGDKGKVGELNSLVHTALLAAQVHATLALVSTTARGPVTS